MSDSLKTGGLISLLNVDLNVASRAIAFRMRKVILLLIHKDQTAYVKGRYIGETVRTIEDIEKVFDSVEHNFNFSVLRTFGFGPGFIQ